MIPDWAAHLGLAVAAAVAGVLNVVAGGGSFLVLPVMIFLGLPPTVANGTNRIGVFLQNVTAAWGFRAQGVSGIEGAAKVVVPVCIGSLAGALTVARLDDATFQRLFGVVMLIDLVPMLRGPRRMGPVERPWPRWLMFAVFVAIVTVVLGGQSLVRQVLCGSGGTSSTNERAVHFGLGRATTIDRIDVLWPSGTTQRLDDVASDQRLTIEEP